MKVVLGAESLSPGSGGIARVARLTALCLTDLAQRRGFEVYCCSLRSHTPLEELGIAHHGHGGSRVSFVWDLLSNYGNSTYYVTDFLGMARALAIPPARFRPFLSWIHGVEMWSGAPRNRVATARRARHLVANTEFTLKRALKDFGPLPKCDVCWLATETNVEPPPRDALDRPTVTIVGRMDADAYKGHRELIENWPAVVTAIPDARLLIVGSGPTMSSFKDMAAASSVSANIEFTGFVPEERMSDVWRETSVFAMPSRGEGFGLVYVEAMRWGIPVIASTHDAASEINLHGSTGFNVNLDDRKHLVDSLIELLRSSKLRSELGSNGRARWKSYFTLDAFKSRFTPILERFIS